MTDISWPYPLLRLKPGKEVMLSKHHPWIFSGALAESPSSPIRPFENLPALPDDLKEAFELFKLAILSHKISGWTEISAEQVLCVLESLKRLALAPAE